MRIIIKILFCTTILWSLSCKNKSNTTITSPVKENSSKNKVNTINIVTNAMDFVTQDTVPSGWNTFKYINKSTEPHFVLFDDYPADKNINHTIKEVAPVFEKGMKLINEGKTQEAMSAFQELPNWFSDIIFTGGSGMVSPNQENTFTIHLKPGNYIIECYVKMPNGTFHTSMGMAKEIWVTEQDSGNKPPKANANISISSKSGIIYNKDEIKSGLNVFKVTYEDQIVHENFVGHDVNLVRLNDAVNITELEAWMNWATPNGLKSPSPKGVLFIGGTNDAPAGSEQYFQAKLYPGKYAFISEVPNAISKGLFKTFTVKD